ncbi:TonB-dependent receptor [Pseudoxanthomonas dokdonensis]|uniref:TonB-dependent receptor n=1 Tax=Pseudoxanthomonas dokdonensis TaxID=344882 RepID=A0A0R0CQN2_9GAMM|nr:TonB-dependent receptor [Pseudoxanthomonas dokdonensis]KRG71654.1 TonB-dependent receptor [Pseudoxanthomonas dokdonensis]
MKTTKLIRYALSVAVATALAPLVQAQEATPTTGEQEATTLDAVVVSGTAKFKGLRKRDASFSISTATPEQIQEAAPTSTADLLKIVPGVWVEPSGGSTGANVFVRGMPSEGDAPFFTLQLDGSPIYPPSTLSFLENSTLFRIDDTVQRVEALRGGTSPIFSNGQPGVTVNFIQKKGDDIPEGSVRLTLGSDNLQRVDVYSGGPLKADSGWYYSVGGFYRETDGVRDAGFPSDKGGQLSATLSKRWAEGEFSLYARHTADDNVFYTAIPLTSRNNGKDISDFPGLDATTGTLLSNDFRRISLPIGPDGEMIGRDLGNGRGVEVSVFGGSLDLYGDNWTVSDRFNFLDGEAPTYALFTGGNPQTLSSYIEDNYGGVAGSGYFSNGDGAVSPDQQVLAAGWWVVEKKIKSFTNDFRLSLDLTDNNTFTVGSYYARYESHDNWHLGNNLLLTAENNARRVDIDLANGQTASRDGLVATTNFGLRGDYTGTNIALFASDEWTVNDRLRLDAGVRYETQQVDGLVLDPVTVDLDGNPDTLYDNNTSVATTPRGIDQTDNDVSWTVGANFTLNEDYSLFARANSGFKMPSFDNLRDNVTGTQEVDQYELGLKGGGDSYDMYLTAFYNEFSGLPFQAFAADGSNIVLVGDSSAYGVEFEGAVRPAGGFELAWNVTWLKANYDEFGSLTADYSGNEVVRQPEIRGRLTPSYYWPMAWGDLKIFTTYTYVGDRYSDPANGQVLPSYQTWDIGASAHVGDHWEFTLSGRNVSDEIGLTEGNARVIGNATDASGVFMGRPIEGPSYLVSAAYKW